MFKKTILSVFLFGTLVAYSQVGIGTTTPTPGSILDIESSDKGILIPRVSLTGTNDITTVTPVTTGLLVFNTVTAGPLGNSVFPGFYYWDAANSLWMQVATGGAVTKDWTVTGNGDIDASTDFIGTTNNQPLRIRTNNLEQFEISIDGRIRANNSGSQNLPTYSFADNTNMGMYRAGNNDLRFATGGNGRLQLTNGFIRSFLNHRFADGTAAAPSIAFQSNTGTGFFRVDPNILGISTAGVERMRIDASGNVGIGTDLPQTNFDVINSNSSFYVGVFENLDLNGSSLLALKENGSLNALGGVTTSNGIGVYGGALSTSLAGTGVFGVSNYSNSDGVVGIIPTAGPWLGFGGLFIGGLGYANGLYNLSDITTKTNIKPIENSLDKILKIYGISFKYDEKIVPAIADGRTYLGFSAQNILEIFPEAVNFKSIPTNSEKFKNTSSYSDLIKENKLVVDYTQIIPVIVAAIQEQQEIIDSQESRIAKLETLINQLINDK